MTTPGSLSERAVFIDTSAFFAFLDHSDRWHAASRATFEQLTAERRPVFTSNLAVGETYALAGIRLGRDIAFQWLSGLDVAVQYQDEGDHVRAFELLEQHHDKTFSYADAVAFALMERQGTKTAFAFDDDFRQLGQLVVLPTAP